MINVDKKNIAKVIQKARRDAHMTQSELAEEIGISEKHMSKLETGKSYPALDTFLKIIDKLNLTLGDFGIRNSLQNSSDKLFLQKIIETSSETQLKACAEVVSTLLKYL